MADRPNPVAAMIHADCDTEIQMQEAEIQRLREQVARLEREREMVVEWVRDELAEQRRKEREQAFHEKFKHHYAADLMQQVLDRLTNPGDTP